MVISAVQGRSDMGLNKSSGRDKWVAIVQLLSSLNYERESQSQKQC